MAPDDGQELFQREPLPEKPTHADILRAVEKTQTDLGVFAIAQQRNAEAIKGLKQREEQRDKRVEDALAEIKELIGYETLDKYGKPIGIGLTGRMMREERRWRWVDDTRRYILGAAAATSILIIVIWWLVRPAIETLLHPGAS
jgi:hypothetical protein